MQIPKVDIKFNLDTSMNHVSIEHSTYLKTILLENILIINKKKSEYDTLIDDVTKQWIKCYMWQFELKEKEIF